MTLEQIVNASEADQVSIHSLPDDILRVIFWINTFRKNEDAFYNHSTTLASAQVCQRWRAVALDYSALWSRIIDYERHSSSWIETLLARSGSSLIDVGGDSVLEPVKLENPRGEPVLQSIFERISTLRTVSLHIRRAPWESICHSFFGHPVPNLEYLNLITSCPFPDCIYPGPFFANEAPRLRRLHLQRCLIDFSSSVLFNLTELSVWNVQAPNPVLSTSDPSKATPSVAGWLEVLKNISTLRFLTLSDAISHFTEQTPLPVVNLPHLVLLTIRTRFYPGISFIDHLSIPSSCGIRLIFSRDYNGSGGFDSPKLLSFLSQQFTHWRQDHSDRYLQAKALTGNTIRFGNSRRIGQVFDKTESDEVEAHSRYSKDPMLSLVFYFGSSQDSFPFFNQLLELYSFTFSTTTTLDFWLDREFANLATTPGSFPSFQTFHSFTNVKTLHILEQSPFYLLPLFQNFSLPDHPLFPALQLLCLSGTNMDDEQGALYSVFVAFLRWRAEARTPLPEIEILSGSISSKTAKDLSRFGNVRITQRRAATSFSPDSDGSVRY